MKNTKISIKCLYSTSLKRGVRNNNLTDAESQAVMVLLRGLIMYVEPSKDYDEINQLIIDTDNSGGILQKDNVKYAAIYESNCTRFAAVANFDD